jgi:hypothetical protein
MSYQEVFVKLKHTENQIKEKNENLNKYNIENKNIE